MEIKGIDVSEWQENINFSKVKESGIKFVILREGYRKAIDKYFLKNVEGFQKAGIPVAGVYHFCYAINNQEVVEEAKSCIANIRKAGLSKDTIVFFDFEYDTVAKAAAKGVRLGKNECILFTKTFCSYVQSQGYMPGVYANLDYYKNMYDRDTIDKYVFWLADYTGEPDVRCTYHQYTSGGIVSGITGNVDMNYFYGKIKEDTGMAKDLWTQTAELMAAQSGYLEKASNYNLDSKTGNAGYNNYTKYARDVNSWGQPGCQGQAWCAVYQFWICVKVFGLAKALQIMGGGFYNCNSIKTHAKANGTWHTTPKLGALIIFRNGAHIGRATKVTSTQVYTNEGNTSSAPGVVANGGAVRDKVYSRNDPDIDGYVWIDYDTESESGSTSTAGKLNTIPKWTGEVTASELNVRSWAGMEYPQIKKWPLLKRTNRVDVCDSVEAVDGSAWYYVRIAGKYYGFVHSSYVKRI